MTVTTIPGITGIITITITIVTTIMSMGEAIGGRDTRRIAELGQRRNHCQRSTYKAGPDEQVLKHRFLLNVVFSHHLDEDSAKSTNDPPSF